MFRRVPVGAVQRICRDPRHHTASDRRIAGQRNGHDEQRFVVDVFTEELEVAVVELASDLDAELSAFIGGVTGSRTPSELR